MSLNEQLNSILNDLRTSVPDIKAALVASTDGLAIAHAVTTGDPNRMAAMIATSLGLGKRISETFGGGDLNETVVGGANAQVYVYAAGSKGVLAAVASGGNVGLIHIEAREAAKKIAALLK